MEPNDLTMRPITGPEEIDLFNRLRYVRNRRLPGDLVDGHRRPEWMWVAQRGEQLLARVAWWCGPGSDTPHVLDVLDIDDDLPAPERVDIGARLLHTAMAATVPEGSQPPEYCRYVPPDWRDNAATGQPVQDRMAILERAGARLFVERFRLEWRPESPVPGPSDRLVFRSLRDTEELLRLMTDVLEGTLDAHGRAWLTHTTPRGVAVRQYEDEFAHYTSPREWWRVATLPDGDPVGFVIPAHNTYYAGIPYIAVLPKHRGNGYIDEVLAEGTRILAAQDVPCIRASTDLGNTPMANAFRRAGYLAIEHEINMTWPDRQR